MNYLLPELKEIKKIRKKFGITQKELSKLSGVSQPMIAKIENGLVQPSYNNAKKIFECLENINKKSSLKAKDIMHEHIESAKKEDNVFKTIKKMEFLGISQMPVIENNTSIGTISEKKTLKIYSENTKREMREEKVFQIMDESMPIVNPDTPFNVLSELLLHNEGVIVAKKGKIKGIITKSDLLQAMLKKK